MLDQRIRGAITSAAADAGQPKLAEKLAAWLEELAAGNTSLQDRDATRRHLELLYDMVVVRTGDTDDSTNK